VSIFHKIIISQIQTKLQNIAEWLDNKEKLISIILQMLKDSNLLNNILCKNEFDKSASFDTVHSRNAMISKYLEILLPEEHSLGIDILTGKLATMQYVSIERTFTVLLKNAKFLDIMRFQIKI
jgi:hypothetical protein